MGATPPPACPGSGFESKAGVVRLASEVKSNRKNLATREGPRLCVAKAFEAFEARAVVFSCLDASGPI